VFSPVFVCLSARRTFGRITCHVIPEPPATLQIVIIPSAILKIVFRHIIYIYIFFFLGGGG